MDPFDEIVIKNYLSLNNALNRLYFRNKQIRLAFYSQNMTTRLEYNRIFGDYYEMVTKGFRPDREVEKLLLNLDQIDNRIDSYLFSEKHFRLFWASLDTAEQTLLMERFNYPQPKICSQELIKRVLDEINEIETAICFREGIEPDVMENEIHECADENLERMCDFFAL